MNKTHKSLAQCPHCEEKGIVSNISGLHSMNESGINKIDKIGFCKKCRTIYKVKLIELVEEGEKHD